MFRLSCTVCHWQAADGDINTCPECGQTIDIIFDMPEIPLDTTLPGIWRYTAHLPLHDKKHIVSLGEGNTPLLESASLGESINLSQLYFKMEGANPTGSYKDRIATVGISRLRELGKKTWAATSSGNAGAAIAAYGARAGLDGHLFTLEKASKDKIAQIMSYAPQVSAVYRLGYDPDVEQATWANIIQVCKQNNWMMLVTARAFSPHAMEGAKTIAYEICEQLDNISPDVVYVPVGGGGLLSTAWKGFVEWHKAGKINKLPRMVAVQAQGCDAVTQAWNDGSTVSTIPDCHSSISGIQLTAPPDGNLVLQALKESQGWATSVPDEETYQAQAELSRREGVFVEPASAITWAAVQADKAQGRLTGDEKVICVLSGIGFKDMTAIKNMVAEHSVPLITADEILSKAENGL
ncbi:MAG: threonine synthase [Anaerolineae bacterium]|nr:threonine synthase [Anaerolineae bacterium]MDQ7037154.1 threonine synthase [Anaerolineae bacterium]